jgi:hypothetical protein
LEVVDRRELGRDSTADLLRRRVGSAELRELLLDSLELAQASVEVGVGQCRVVEDVVTPPGIVHLLAQLTVTLLGLGSRRLRFAHGPILPTIADRRRR